MSFNNSPYDAIGVAIVGELFKQAEEIYPISDEPTKPSLFKRLVGWLKQEDDCREEVPCGDEMSAQPTA